MSIEGGSVASQNRARHSGRLRTTAVIAAGGLMLAACSSKAPAPAPMEGTVAAATTTTTEPTITTTTPTSTTTSEVPSTTTEIVTRPALCAMGDQLGITASMPNAPCSEYTYDSDFRNVLDGAQWVLGGRVVIAKIIKDQGEFQIPANYGAQNVPIEERRVYGEGELADYNVLCSPDACFARQGQGLVSEVAGGVRQENLEVLSRLVSVSENWPES